MPHLNRQSWLVAGWIAFLAILVGSLNFNNGLIPPSLYLIRYRSHGMEFAQGLVYSVTYPMWGYPLLVAGVALFSMEWLDALIFAIQVAVGAGLVLMWLFPLKISWRPRQVAILTCLLVPVFSFVSLRAPDAWAVMAMMFILLCLRNWMQTKRRVWVVSAAIAAAIGVNMRSELLGFFVSGTGIALLGVFLIKQIWTRQLAIWFSVLFIGAGIGLIPWMIHAYRLTGVVLLSSTNSGMTMYEGFAQIPNNPWGRQDCDCEPQRYADSIGVRDIVSVQGNDALLAASLQDIKKYPMVYVAKVGYNFVRALTSGVHWMDDWWGPKIVHGSTQMQRLQRALTGEPLALVWLVRTLGYWFYRGIFFVMCIGAFWLAWRAVKSDQISLDHRLLILFSVGYLLYTFLMVALIRFEVRYATPPYPLLVFMLVNLFASGSWREVWGEKLARVFTRVQNRRFGEMARNNLNA
jgi:hypothetical protein